MDFIKTIFGYDFKDKKLLTQALSHPSLFNQKGTPYQRLEFLGDRILGMVIADLIYRKFPKDAEGDLAKRHAALVRLETLASIAMKMKLGDHILISKSEEDQGGRLNPSTLADALESLIAALYLDGGLEVITPRIHKLWAPYLTQNLENLKDSKSTLQELVQKQGKEPPKYRVLEVTGPAHKPAITVEVSIEGYPPQQVTAPTKRLGEQEAAKIMLSHIKRTH